MELSKGGFKEFTGVGSCYISIGGSSFVGDRIILLMCFVVFYGVF